MSKSGREMAGRFGGAARVFLHCPAVATCHVGQCSVSQESRQARSSFLGACLLDMMMNDSISLPPSFILRSSSFFCSSS